MLALQDRHVDVELTQVAHGETHVWQTELTEAMPCGQLLRHVPPERLPVEQAVQVVDNPVQLAQGDVQAEHWMPLTK